VIRSIEEEIPDAKFIRSHLLKDLRLAGIELENHEVVAEGTCIKISTKEELTEESRGILMRVCDTYSRTYSEIEVLVASKIDDTQS
jgi:hypothetical protein